MHTLQLYPAPARCVSNSEKRSTTKQVCRSPSPHTETIDPQQKTRSVLHKRRRNRRRNAMSFPHEFANTKHYPPAPARSAVNRTASVTTGHTPHNVLTTCTAKERDGYPQVCYPSPSFSLHRARRVSFSPVGRKRNGGRIPLSPKGKNLPRQGGHPFS